jgi:hypothetical protein
MIEVYWPTRLDYGQPYGHPIDLSQPEEALLRDVEQLASRQGITWSPASAAAPPSGDPPLAAER